METTEQGCVIIKRKEYEELKKKADDVEIYKSPRKIYLSIDVTSRIIKDNINTYFSNECIHRVTTTGTVNLSEKLRHQIGRIAQGIVSNHHKEVIEINSTHEKQLKSEKEGLLEAFARLPWYKRLFFKYVKEENKG